MTARLAALAIAVILAFAGAAAARADERYAAIVIDAASGEVLHARHADAPRRPASLVKLMTLYLAFEAVEAGALAFDDVLVASDAAADAPRVRLGLDAGEQITVDEAVRALIVASANDAAIVLAQALADDEAAFAELMNARAASLGMTRTRFANASGLPDADQISTARDMARLAAALRADFPQYYPLFSLRTLDWDGRRIGGHNHVLDMVEGADGLKTGYIDASGYNVAASAVRDGRRLDVVVMGGPSAATRDAHAAALFEAGFAYLAERDAGPAAAPPEPPEPPADRDNAALILASYEEDPEPPAPQTPRLRIVLVGPDGQTLEAPADAEPAPPPPRPLAPGEPPVAAEAAAPPDRAPGDWSIQVGAFSSAERARERLEEVARAAPDALAGARLVVAPASEPPSDLWRARFSGFTRPGAQAACDAVRAADARCFVVGP